MQMLVPGPKSSCTNQTTLRTDHRFRPDPESLADLKSRLTPEACKVLFRQSDGTEKKVDTVNSCTTSPIRISVRDGDGREGNNSSSACEEALEKNDQDEPLSENRVCAADFLCISGVKIPTSDESETGVRC